MKLSLTVLFPIIVLTTSCSQLMNVGIEKDVYDLEDIYKCLSKDNCKFGYRSMVTYSDDKPFKDNNTLIKEQLAETYFSSPSLNIPSKKSVLSLLEYIQRLNDLSGFKVLDYNNEKGVIFSKGKSEIEREVLGYTWKKTYLIISSVERSNINNNIHIYFVVQPMEKKPLSSLYTVSSKDKRSEEIIKYLTNKVIIFMKEN